MYKHGAGWRSGGVEPYRVACLVGGDMLVESTSGGGDISLMLSMLLQQQYCCAPTRHASTPEKYQLHRR